MTDRYSTRLPGSGSRKLISLLPLLAFLLGCGGDGERGGAADAPAWRAERVATISGAGEGGHGGGAGAGHHGGGPAGFAQISSVLADDSGFVYVADFEARQIHVCEGAGPGEFRFLVSLAWMGDTLAALDPVNTRIALLSRDGRPLGAWPYPPLTGNPTTIRLFRASDHEFRARVARPARDGSMQRLYVRFTPQGAADTVASPASAAGQQAVVCRVQAGLSVFEVPFRYPSVLDFSPDGAAAVVEGDDYRIAFVGPRGDTLRTVTREYDPVRVTDEEWERETEGFRRFRRAAPGARCDPPSPPRPAAKDAIRWLMFAPSGEMWVEATTPGGFAWDVFGADGRLLGSLPAPERAPGVPPYVRGDRLYVVRADSLGVQYVDVYRVRR
jgi:hypothetical protein